MDFYQWLINEKGLSEYSSKRYLSVIYKQIKDWLPSYEIPQNSIEFEALKLTIFDLEIYKERNRIGNNMYSSALNHYGHYLRQNDVHDSAVFTSNHLFTSEAERKIKVRLVQNKFRKGLFDYHPYCAISGLSSAPFLIASHIKPWSRCNDLERLDPFNGLLLTPNYDRLFDRGFIGFKHSGEIIISSQLKQMEREFFNLPNRIFIDLRIEHQMYLEFHRDEIFQV